MFSFPTPSVYQASKCFVSSGTMKHVDPEQLPTKVKPWNTLMAQDFIHKVDLILPNEFLHHVKSQVIDTAGRAPTYSRVIMTLGQVLQGEFFTEYIKIGTLTMYLDKETYERAGLVGKPYGVKGRRGTKPRWVVQYNLRHPSMLHGKKGFDRLSYACKNVLNKPTTWLFCNLSKTPNPDPLAGHYPVTYTSNAAILEELAVKVPQLSPSHTTAGSNEATDLEEYGTDIYEWLSLIRLGSPRVDATDTIDPYLCQYVVPGDAEGVRTDKLCKVTWQGFISPRWAAQTLAQLMEALPSHAWLSFGVTTFSRSIFSGCNDWVFLRPPSSAEEYVLWESKGHE
ncbi:ribonuclease P 40kDa subunit-domain-containing protein [Xylariomycetidae sp. FL0641]|nr:ribonuclease P 40kDa subunit-domain-containing protein [Xylariomycetidae sp. FL0641]